MFKHKYVFLILLLISISFSQWPKYQRDLNNTGAADNSFTIFNYTYWSKNFSNRSIGSMAFYNGIIYFPDGNNTLFALNASTGQHLWNYSVNLSNFSFSRGAIVNNGILYIGSTLGYFYAINASTGALIWNSSIGGTLLDAIIAEALYYRGRVFFGNENPLNSRFFAFNASTGAHLWNISIVSPNRGAASYYNDYVIFPASLTGKKLYAVNYTNGSIVWTFDVPSTVVTTTAVDEQKGIIYFPNGNYLFALNASTGQQLWNVSFPGGALATSSPTLYKDYVLVGITGGVIYVNSSSKAIEKFYSLPSLIGRVIGSPTVSQNGIMYFGVDSGNKKSYAVNITSNETIYSFQAQGDIQANHLLWNRMVFFFDNTTVLYAIGKNKPPRFFNISTYPVSPVVYSPIQSYSFNVTWIDEDLYSVWIEHNFTGNLANYTMNLTPNGLFSYNYSPLPAGNYTFKWYANDTWGNMNSTSSLFYIVLKASPNLSLSILPSTTVTYPTTTNVSCSGSSQVNITLYRNGTLIASGFGYVEDNSLLAAGLYSYTCNTTGNQNYTSALVNGNLSVNKGNPSLNLSVSPSSFVSPGVVTNVSCSSSSQLNLSLYRNGTLIASGFGYVEEVTSLPIGNHVYLCNTTGNQNYTNGSSSLTVSVSNESSPPPTTSNPSLKIKTDFLCPDNILEVYVYDSIDNSPLDNAKTILQIFVGNSYSSLLTEYTLKGYSYFPIKVDGQYRVLAYRDGYDGSSEETYLSLCQQSNLTINNTNISMNITPNDSVNLTFNDSNFSVNLSLNESGFRNISDNYNESIGEERRENREGRNRKEGENRQDVKGEIGGLEASQKSMESVEYPSQRTKANIIENLFGGAVIFSQSCCLFNICSFFGFVEFLGICWYVWIFLIFLIIIVFIYWKLYSLNKRKRSSRKRYK